MDEPHALAVPSADDRHAARVAAEAALEALAEAEQRLDLTLAAVRERQRRRDQVSRIPRVRWGPGVAVSEAESPAAARPSVSSAPGVGVSEGPGAGGTVVQSPDGARHAYRVAWDAADVAVRRWRRLCARAGELPRGLVVPPRRV